MDRTYKLRTNKTKARQGTKTNLKQTDRVSKSRIGLYSKNILPGNENIQSEKVSKKSVSCQGCCRKKNENKEACAEERKNKRIGNISVISTTETLR